MLNVISDQSSTPDEYLHPGAYDYLRDVTGLTANKIYEAIKEKL